MDQATKTLLSGLGNDAGIGAGIGALGMGVSNLLQPDDPYDTEHHKKSLLKSMLLGGALGGVTGGGLRAIGNTFSDQLRNDPGSGINSLLNNPIVQKSPTGATGTTSTPTTGSKANWFDQVVGAHPIGYGGSIGAIAGTTASKMARNTRINYEMDRQGLVKKDNVKLTQMEPTEAKLMNPGLHGLLGALILAYYGYKVHGTATSPGLEREQLINNALQKNRINLAP